MYSMYDNNNAALKRHDSDFADNRATLKQHQTISDSCEAHLVQCGPDQS